MCYEYFPAVDDQGSIIKNPAIKLFGNRLYRDQSPVEFLIELLMVTTSSKKVKKDGNVFNSLLPTMQMLHDWPENTPLFYSTKARLNLKGTSKNSFF